MTDQRQLLQFTVYQSNDPEVRGTIKRKIDHRTYEIIQPRCVECPGDEDGVHDWVIALPNVKCVEDGETYDHARFCRLCTVMWFTSTRSLGYATYSYDRWVTVTDGHEYSIKHERG